MARSPSVKGRGGNIRCTFSTRWSMVGRPIVTPWILQGCHCKSATSGLSAQGPMPNALLPIEPTHRLPTTRLFGRMLDVTIDPFEQQVRAPRIVLIEFQHMRVARMPNLGRCMNVTSPSSPRMLAPRSRHCPIDVVPSRTGRFRRIRVVLGMGTGYLGSRNRRATDLGV